jgi:hypothetical protein
MTRQEMNKPPIREFRLASICEASAIALNRGIPWPRAFGEGSQWRFRAFAQRDLEIVVSAGFGVTVNLGARNRLTGDERGLAGLL